MNAIIARSRLPHNRKITTHRHVVYEKRKPTITEGVHFMSSSHVDNAEPTYRMNHPIWTKEYERNVEITHEPVKTTGQRMARKTIDFLRLGFDFFSGYSFGKITNTKLLRRMVFLETVAGVPGMVAAMVRHLQSLRTMKHDKGWIHTLLEEAENERMHLLVAMELYNPGYILRAAILIAQGLWVNAFFIAYLISPHFCHSAVGYLEEEAVKTYTQFIEAMETGKIDLGTKKAPKVAIKYWQLEKDATMLDVILAVRADESYHRDVNHTLAFTAPYEPNPVVDYTGKRIEAEKVHEKKEEHDMEK